MDRVEKLTVAVAAAAGAGFVALSMFGTGPGTPDRVCAAWRCVVIPPSSSTFVSESTSTQPVTTVRGPKDVTSGPAR